MTFKEEITQLRVYDLIETIRRRAPFLLIPLISTQWRVYDMIETIHIAWCTFLCPCDPSWLENIDTKPETELTGFEYWYRTCGFVEKRAPRGLFAASG